MRDYGKIYSSFWTSETTRSLSDQGRVLAAYLLTGPHANMIGCYRLPDGYVAEDLGWGFETVSKGFAELEEKGFATRDSESKWVFVKAFLRWNEVENPNQAIPAIKLAMAVPDTLASKPALLLALLDSIGRFKDKIRADVFNPFETLCETVSKPGTGTGTGTGELLGASLSPVGDPLRCPTEELLALYHEAMPENPRCKVLNPARRAAIRARWLEAARLDCQPFGYSTREDGVRAWREFFQVCNESPFLTGRAKPQPGKPPFFADVDFLFSPGGFAKCIENKYHREAA